MATSVMSTPKQRELVPYFLPEDPEASMNLCVLSPNKKSKAPVGKDSKKIVYTPEKKSRSPPKDYPVQERRHQFAGPAFLTAPDPNLFPIPTFLLASKSSEKISSAQIKC